MKKKKKSDSDLIRVEEYKCLKCPLKNIVKDNETLIRINKAVIETNKALITNRSENKLISNLSKKYKKKDKTPILIIGDGQVNSSMKYKMSTPNKGLKNY